MLGRGKRGRGKNGRGDRGDGGGAGQGGMTSVLDGVCEGDKKFNCFQ